MAVKIRMTRMGRRHRPFFRINAIDSRAPRDGKILEKLGHYDPIEKDRDRQVVLNTERIKYWLEQGAIPSDRVSELLLRAGIRHKYAEQRAAKRAKARDIAHKKGKFFTKAEKIAAEKAVEQAEAKVKAEAEAKAKAEKEAEADAKAEAEKEAKAKVREETAAKAQAEVKKQAQPEAETETKKAEVKEAEQQASQEVEKESAEKPEEKSSEESQETKQSDED